MITNSGVAMERADYKWKKFDRKRTSYEKKYARLFLQELNKQTREVIKQVSPESVRRWMDGSLREETLKIRQDAIKGIIEKLNIEMGIDFAKEVYDEFKDGKKKSIKVNLPSNAVLFGDDEEELIDYWTSYIKSYVAREGAERITSIAMSQRKQAVRLIKRIIDKGIAEGWGAEEISKAIEKTLESVMIPMNKYRALRIARTETLMAASMGSVMGARSLDMPMQKIWIATPFGDYRPDHLALHNKAVDLDDKFDVGGILMDRPGDPAGGPENCCNCRCSISFKPKKIE